MRSEQKIYHIDRIIRETGKNFDDGTHIVYVNGSYKGEEGNELDDLIHDFFCDNPEDMRHKQLADRVNFLKTNEQEADNVCKIIEDLQDEREKETRISDLRNLMKKLKMTAQEAMDILEIPADKQKEYSSLI